MSELVVSENYSKAVLLDRKIKTNAQAAQESLYEVCKGLKEMRDGKLYKELGYQNFEDYSENEVGMSKRNANRYVAIAEMLESGTPVSQNIGATKLYLLSTLSEPDREEIIQNNSVEDMTKRELEEKIKEIKQLKEEKQKALELHKELEKKYSQKEDLIEQLEDRIEEMENRPVPVAVADNSHEIENMRKAMDKCDKEWAEKYSAKQDENFELSREVSRYQKRIEELENAEKEESPADGKEVFKAYLANSIDAMNRLIGCLKLYPDYKSKVEEFIETTKTKLEEI